MSQCDFKIGNKIVQSSRPYRAPMGRCVGRDQEIQKIMAAWMHGSAGLPLSPLLLGEPGLGKNSVVYECAGMCSKELYILQGHEDITAEDLVCMVRFSDDPGKKMDYILSPLLTAMIRGGVCFIDEIAKIRPRALAPLASLLDERRYVDSTFLGERVIAHPGFRFIAATNRTDVQNQVDCAIPDFIRSRLRPVIHFGYPDRPEIETILRTRFKPLRANGTKLLDRFWQLWHDNENARPPTPRDSIYVFGYALNLADRDAVKDASPGALECGTGSANVKERHIEEAFNTFNAVFKERAS